MNKFLLLILTTALTALAGSPKQMQFSMPEMIHPPRIDGRIDRDEWRDAVEINGLVQLNSCYLSGRQGTFHFGLDRQYFYLAAATELPPKGMALLSRVRKPNGAVFLDDNIELQLCPPDEKFVYQLLLNSLGTRFGNKFPITYGGTTATDHQPWMPEVETKSGFQNGCWILEARIPLKELGQHTAPAAGSCWKLVAARTWQSPAEQTTLKQTLIFCNPDDMVRSTWNPGLPHVSYLGLGEKAREGDFQIAYEIHNTGSSPREVSYRISVVSDAAPRSLDTSISVPPGKTVPVVLEFSEKTSVLRDIDARFTDVKTGAVLYERRFIYDPAVKARWIDPKQKRSAELEIGVYPYYEKVRARFGNPAEKITGWQEARFSIRTENGQVISSLPGRKTAWGYEAEFNFKPKAGKYALTAELVDADGKKQIRKETFHIEKFPWEHNRIGCDRIIIPPYKPLQVQNSRTVNATLTGYHFRNGFFDRISADGMENILAAPIALYINREKVQETAFQFTEKSPDRIRTRTRLRWKQGEILVKGRLDYDGFYRYTMNFQPRGSQQIDSAVLVIPLKNEIARRIHSVCNRMKYNDAAALPQNQGVIWRSSQSERNPQVAGNYRPYIWIGDLERGLVWLTETDRHWSLDNRKDAQEIVRLQDRTELRIHLVNRPAVWQEKFTLEQAFQATPVRPMPAYRRRLTERITLPNGWKTSLYSGSFCWSGYGRTGIFNPCNKDYSFVRYLKTGKFSKEDNQKIIDDFTSRNCGGMTSDTRASFIRHLKRGIHYGQQAKYKIPYTNARFSNIHWQDHLTYMDEWWCSEYRAKNADEYNNSPVRSYQDMALFYLRKLVREGMDGVYYDNIRDWTSTNTVTGPAYRRPDSQIQPYFDFFDMREFLRRTAVMLYQEKKTFPDGRPVLTFHMTNTNIVPFLAFGSIGLDLEAEYGSKDFQDRFSEDYLKTCTLGLQTGIVPEVLIQITGKNREFVTRTFLAVTLAYDLPMVLNGGGPTGTWYSTWKKLYSWGYSTPEVRVSPCWTADTLKASVPSWRITTYRKPGEIIAAVSSFGDTAEGSLNLDGSGKVMQAANWENGEILPITDGKVRLKIPKHDFKLVIIRLK